MRHNGDPTFGPKTFRQPTEKFIEQKGLYWDKYLLLIKTTLLIVYVCSAITSKIYAKLPWKANILLKKLYIHSCRGLFAKL